MPWPSVVQAALPRCGAKTHSHASASVLERSSSSGLLAFVGVEDLQEPRVLQELGAVRSFEVEGRHARDPLQALLQQAGPSRGDHEPDERLQVGAVMVSVRQEQRVDPG